MAATAIVPAMRRMPPALAYTDETQTIGQASQKPRTDFSLCTWQHRQFFRLQSDLDSIQIDQCREAARLAAPVSYVARREPHQRTGTSR